MDETKLTNFILKLWSILDDQSLSKVICWDMLGKSFHIIDVYSFCEIVLPRFFKHKNIASFVRQLNLYGFKKIATIDRLPQADILTDHMHFAHPYFLRDNPQLMTRIKRNCTTLKRSSQPTTNRSTSLVVNDEQSAAIISPDLPVTNRSIINEEVSSVFLSPNNISAVPAITGGGDRLITENGEQMMLVAEDELNEILRELKNLRVGHSNLHNKVGDLSRENEMLWNEMGLLREFCERQRQSVSKLVQFLLTLVQPGGTGASHHAQKHRFNHHTGQVTKPKRLVPFIEPTALSENAQYDVNFLCPSGGGGDANFDNENDMAIAAPQQFASVLASQSLQPITPNWDILACVQKDILSQAIDYSTMSALQPLLSTPPGSPLMSSSATEANTLRNLDNSAHSSEKIEYHNHQQQPRKSSVQFVQKTFDDGNDKEMFTSILDPKQISLAPNRNLRQHQKYEELQHRNPNLRNSSQQQEICRRIITKYNDNSEEGYEYPPDKRIVEVKSMAQLSSSNIRPTINSFLNGHANYSSTILNSVYPIPDLKPQLHIQSDFTVNENYENSSVIGDVSEKNIVADHVVVLSPTNLNENSYKPQQKNSYQHEQEQQLQIMPRSPVNRNDRQLVPLYLSRSRNYPKSPHTSLQPSVDVAPLLRRSSQQYLETSPSTFSSNYYYEPFNERADELHPTSAQSPSINSSNGYYHFALNGNQNLSPCSIKYGEDEDIYLRNNSPEIFEKGLKDEHCTPLPSAINYTNSTFKLCQKFSLVHLPDDVSSRWKSATPAKRMRNDSFVTIKNNKPVQQDDNLAKHNNYSHFDLIENNFALDLSTADNVENADDDNYDDDFFVQIKTAAEAIGREDPAPLEFDAFNQLNCVKIDQELESFHKQMID